MKLKRNTLIFILLWTLLLIPILVMGQDSEEPEKKDKLISFDVDGFYRLRWTRISEIDAYPEGPVPATWWYWDQRWRIAPEVKYSPGLPVFKSVSLHASADMFDGSFGIEEERSWDLRFDERTWGQPFLLEDSEWKKDGFFLRSFWSQLDIGIAVVRFGRMGSQWGKGILASDSADFDDDFGDNYFGDIVDRIAIATKPIDLVTGGKVETDIIVAFAYDWQVVQDSTADEEDNASQYLIALFKEPEKDTGELLHDLMVGVYFVNREQDDDTKVKVVDFTFRMPFLLFDEALKLVPSAEVVYIWGETNANRSLNAPEGSDIEMGGFVGSLAAETKYIDLIAEGGYASGDPNPFDNKITNMSFNPDYNVGLILFERVLAAATANSSARFSDPALSAQPPAGIELLPTNGSVTNAIYYYPRLKVRPSKGLEVVMGLLYAEAPEDLVDPYRSFLNGGVATNYNGGEADSELGYEFDLGVSYTVGDPNKYALRMGGQWGWFWPGDAFNDAQGNSMNNIDFGQFRLDVLY